jgi:hypothetical protein
MGVAEHLLAPQHAVVAEHDVLSLGQIGQRHHSVGEPLAVRVESSEFGLDLVVADDSSLGGVDQEHLARLETALGDDPGRIDVDHPDLRGHDHEVVVGHPVAARAQAVAVEDSADHLTIGERHAGGAVPRLHHRCVELVEVALLLRHRLVVLPGFRDHHQHRMVDRVSAEVQQFEHLVEPGGVG